LFAQQAPNAGITGLWTFLPYIAIIGLWFYLLLIRPQQKQEQTRRQMLGGLKKNDKVITSGGIYGTVMSVDADSDRVVLRIDDDRGIKVTFSKVSILKVLDSQDKEKAAGTT